MCEHSEWLLLQERARRASTFDLYATYYKQCHAQAKGIRRLRRKIDKLEAKIKALTAPA
jgi:hypothetical protein